jgi:membrane protein DedA with SNARE-associated domain
MDHLLSQDHIVAILQTYGYGALFAVVALECCGLPLPGETMLIGAAIYAAQTRALPIGSIVIVAAAGAILGDNLGYWIGRRYGVAYLERRGGWFGLTPSRLRLAQYLFQRWGGWIVFFGRFITLLRIFAAVLAGANRLDPLRFFLFNAAGGILWASAFGFGAYRLTTAFKRIEGPLGLAAFTALIVALVALWRYLKRHEQRLAREAEAEAARREGSPAS